MGSISGCELRHGCGPPGKTSTDTRPRPPSPAHSKSSSPSLSRHTKALSSSPPVTASVLVLGSRLTQNTDAVPRESSQVRAGLPPGVCPSDRQEAHPLPPREARLSSWRRRLHPSSSSASSIRELKKPLPQPQILPRSRCPLGCRPLHHPTPRPRSTGKCVRGSQLSARMPPGWVHTEEGEHRAPGSFLRAGI